VAWRNLALVSCVLLVQLVGWLSFVSDSREPLMGLAAYLALSYQLLWCAIAVSSTKRLPVAMAIVLVAAYPTGISSWIVLAYAYMIFKNFGPVGLVIGFVLASGANAVVVTAPLMLVDLLLADSTGAHRFALRPAMTRALRHTLGGVAVLPLTIAAMILHMSVYSVGHAIPWLLALPTPLLILAHFALEAGTAAPHALLTLPAAPFGSGVAQPASRGPHRLGRNHRRHRTCSSARCPTIRTGSESHGVCGENRSDTRAGFGRAIEAPERAETRTPTFVGESGRLVSASPERGRSATGLVPARVKGTR
jgi:hypothetical protein